MNTEKQDKNEKQDDEKIDSLGRVEKEKFLQKWDQLKIFILNHPVFSKCICVGAGIFSLVESYTPGVSYLSSLYGTRYISTGGSLNGGLVILGLFFFAVAYLIHRKKWPVMD